MTPPERMTADEFWDFCQLPENANRILELIRGEVVQLPRPYLKHGVVCANLSYFLSMYERDADGSYALCGNPGVILAHDPGTVIGPDVAVFPPLGPGERLPDRWDDTLPVVAAEVVSPNDDPAVTAAKVAEYLRAGVPVVWVVDYEAGAVTALRPGRPPDVLTRADDLTAAELPGFRIPVDDLFRTPSERAARRRSSA